MQPKNENQPKNNELLAHLGEDWVIREAEQRFGTFLEGGTGIGDDAAILPIGETKAITTVDLLIEGVHFRRETASPEDIGWKSLAVNLSDLAAMGAVPRWAVLGLALPGDLPGAWVQGFFDGMRELADLSGIPIVGGDTVGSPGPIMISLTAIGETLRPVLRTGCQPGWVLLVTGSVGGSAAGLWALEHEPVEEELLEYGKQKHLRPRPQLEAGRILAEGEACMLDNSDGLFRSLQLLAEGSALTARIESSKVPIDEETKILASRAHEAPMTWALWGGEDYNLVAAVPSERFEKLSRQLEAAGIPCHELGRLEAGDPKVILDGKRVEARSFRHFRAGASKGSRSAPGADIPQSY